MGDTRRTFGAFGLAAIVGLALVACAGAAHALKITQPRENETITTNRFWLAGTAAKRVPVQVIVQRLRVRDDRGEWRTIYDEKMRTDPEGVWSDMTSAGGVSGDYRIIARRLEDGGRVKTEESLRFRVQLRDDDDDDDRDDGDGRLRIEQPDNGATVTTSRVLIAGTASPGRELIVRLTAADGEVVRDDTGRVGHDGRWSLAVYLPRPGRYRIRAELPGPPGKFGEARLVTFFYAPDGRGESGAIRITDPDDGATVRQAPFYVKGRAPDRADVRVRVYDARGREVHSERTRADRDGAWSARLFPDAEGTYRVVAELLNERGDVVQRAAISFRYDRR